MSPSGRSPSDNEDGVWRTPKPPRRHRRAGRRDAIAQMGLKMQLSMPMEMRDLGSGSSLASTCCPMLGTTPMADDAAPGDDGGSAEANLTMGP